MERLYLEKIHEATQVPAVTVRRIVLQNNVLTKTVNKRLNLLRIELQMQFDYRFSTNSLRWYYMVLQFYPCTTTVVSPEPFLHRPRALRCL